MSDIGSFWSRQNLKPPFLLAAAKRASQSDLWIAQPIGKEGLVFEWVTSLEQKLNAGAVVCPTGCARRPYENFLAHWQGGGERNVKPPEILIANGWDDQVEGIVHNIAGALTKQTQSILVVVPENSATGRACSTRSASRPLSVPVAYHGSSSSISCRPGCLSIAVMATSFDLLPG